MCVEQWDRFYRGDLQRRTRASYLPARGRSIRLQALRTTWTVNGRKVTRAKRLCGCLRRTRWTGEQRVFLARADVFPITGTLAYRAGGVNRTVTVKLG